MVLDFENILDIQYKDKDGLVMPWLTKDSLDVISKWDFSGKDVFEWGGGYSTVYFAQKAKTVVTIESNDLWVQDIHDTLIYLGVSDKVLLHNIPSEMGILYIEALKPLTWQPDIILVDGLYRDGCSLEAFHYCKKGGVIIIDNYCQKEVWNTSQSVQDLVNQYPHEIYPQQNGDSLWQTCIIQK